MASSPWKPEIIAKRLQSWFWCRSKIKTFQPTIFHLSSCCLCVEIQHRNRNRFRDRASSPITQRTGGGGDWLSLLGLKNSIPFLSFILLLFLLLKLACWTLWLMTDVLLVFYFCLRCRPSDLPKFIFSRLFGCKFCNSASTRCQKWNIK